MVFRKSNKGASIVEYGSLVGLVAIVAVAAVSTTGREIENSFAGTTSSMSGVRSASLAADGASRAGGGTPVAAVVPPEVVPCEFTGQEAQGGICLADGGGWRIVSAVPVDDIAWASTDVNYAEAWGVGDPNSPDPSGLTEYITSSVPLGEAPAAQYCGTLSEGGYGDWFLPNSGMMQLYYDAFPGEMTSRSHWTIRENMATGAVYHHTADPSNSFRVHDKAELHSVVCMRYAA